MPSSRQFLVEGYDPTGTACVDISGLLQMIRASAPASDVGYTIWSDTAPDVVTYPELARFLWGETSGGVRTGNLFFWNGSSWQNVSATVVMPDASITAAKLQPSGFGYYVWANNAAASAVVPVPITTILNAGIFTVDSNPTSQYFLEKRSGTFMLSGVNGQGIWYKSISPAKLNTSGASHGYAIVFDSLTSEARWAQPTVELSNYSIEWRKIKYGTNIVGISSGAIIVDASLSGNHLVTLTANVTSVTVSNMVDGQTLQIAFLQDGTGGRTVDFTGSNIRWAGGSGPAITTTADHADIVSISNFAGKLVGVVAPNINFS